jgi:hypothetical protein
MRIRNFAIFFRIWFSVRYQSLQWETAAQDECEYLGKPAAEFLTGFYANIPTKAEFLTGLHSDIETKPEFLSGLYSEFFTAWSLFL